MSTDATRGGTYTWMFDLITYGRGGFSTTILLIGELLKDRYRGCTTLWRSRVEIETTTLAADNDMLERDWRIISWLNDESMQSCDLLSSFLDNRRVIRLSHNNYQIIEK